MTLGIPGFGYSRVPTGSLTLNVAAGGSGTPIVLLHGFPQTHLAWRDVATELARDHLVICPDLRGYGDSDKPHAEVEGETYSKRQMAQDVVGLMRTLGHDRFCLVGHDRGALVAFRAAMDHPEAISHLAVLDVIPQADMGAALLAHPADLPERMIGSYPDVFFGHFLDTWSTKKTTMPEEVRSAYLEACRSPEAIAAICADYRAGVFIDPHHNETDRTAGRQLKMPVAAMWQDPRDVELPFDPQAIWQSWAPDLRTHVLPGGHFLPEDCPQDVTTAIRELYSAGRS